MSLRVGWLLFICFLSLSSCKHDVNISGAPEVSFKFEVQSIISGNCTESECHGTNGQTFPLVTYNDIAGNVEPGNARNSKLYQSVTGKGGVSFMPPSSRQALTNDQIRLIYIWIQQGAKNN